MNPEVTQIYNHFKLMISKQRAISSSPLHTPPLQHPIPANSSSDLNQKWDREDVPGTSDNKVQEVAAVHSYSVREVADPFYSKVAFLDSHLSTFPGQSKIKYMSYSIPETGIIPTEGLRLWSAVVTSNLTCLPEQQEAGWISSVSGTQLSGLSPQRAAHVT